MIAIINTGCANINSVRFAFERLGITPEVITDPAQLQHFERAILPGVGHAKVAMERLKQGGWPQAIAEYDKPLMGICLGMQLLCEHTNEGDVTCLGMIPGNVQLLEVGELTSPHMGWNNLNNIKAHPLTKRIDQHQQVYFVHSFAHTPNDSSLAQCEYGSAFSAIVANDNYAGMQFHPERSAKVGAQLLQNFIDWQLP
ncbi:Imidazole glycerol phosphate synthase subunit HisH [Pseudoalteromonas holothuriae]|uniref:Imidazole glycerol phosphate synthase subunit HisH n=1 Tax=Pseudoalteromonas holothuriae TaxID=2963714 RepID=A0ABN8UHE4_9GAMM|nr:imidazole glycerol phosphate synthase subunit HisH [Pseudoalteromonas sp. CIP111951]CAH9050891.1 Imidazole glycerol phosphate synthase subunit HisH [Pseudoalteromonas sp. CIP111951]